MMNKTTPFFISFFISFVMLLSVQSSEMHYYDSLLYESNKNLKNQTMMIVLDSITKTFTLQGCCNANLRQCLDRKPECSLAQRFTNYASWLALFKLPFDTTMRYMNDRYKSLIRADTVSIAESYLATAGLASAPYTITIYISLSCPKCKRICIPLYHAVTDGQLRGIAKLRIKPFSQGSGNLMLFAAQKFNKWWELYLSLEKETKRIDQQLLLTNAYSLGLDTSALKQTLAQDTLKRMQKLYESEGKKNGVSVTPTIFINNRQYLSSNTPEWILDAVECYKELHHQ